MTRLSLEAKAFELPQLACAQHVESIRFSRQQFSNDRRSYGTTNIVVGGSGAFRSVVWPGHTGVVTYSFI
jgi:hypothetical protein